MNHDRSVTIDYEAYFAILHLLMAVVNLLQILERTASSSPSPSFSIGRFKR
jgi:hypothetical protein